MNERNMATVNASMCLSICLPNRVSVKTLLACDYHPLLDHFTCGRELEQEIFDTGAFHLGRNLRRVARKITHLTDL
jgi:hypothetical protein